MDFSILYRVVWKPSAVFKQFKGKSRLEPYILIGAIVIFQGLKPYVGHLGNIAQAPFALMMNLMVGYVFFLAFPIVNTIIVTLTTTFLRSEKAPFLSILSAFILCSLPYYIEVVLALSVGYTPTGLGFFFPSLEASYPFLFGMISTIAPAFLWAIVLWWFAVKQLLSLQEWKNVFIVISLVLVNIVLGGWIWRMTSSFVPKNL